MYCTVFVIVATVDADSLMTVLFVFCKQKTAYEMRSSDWSSDVCSSDLLIVGEFFWREILLGCRHRQELLARTRQERLAIAAVDRDIFLRLQDQAEDRKSVV